MTVARDRVISLLQTMAAFFLLLGVLLRPLVCGMSGGLALNILVTLPVVAAALVWVFGMVMQREIRLRRTPLDLPIVFLIIFTFASVGVAAYKEAAASIAFDWLSYILLFYLVVNLCAEMSKLAPALIAATVSSTFVVSLNGFVQNFYSLELTRRLFLQNQEAWVATLGLPPDAASDFVGRLATGRVFSTFLLPNTCAGFLGVLIPLQVGLMVWGVRALRKTEGEKRPFVFTAINAAALAASVLCLFYTKSKGGWISLVLAALVFLFIGGRRWLVRYWHVLIGIGFIILSLFIALQLTHRAPPLDEYFESFKVRKDYWRAGALIVKDHPWFGVGLGGFGDYYAQYRRPQDDESQMAHNNYIQVWAETGVFGLAAFCAVWVMFFLTMRREAQTEGSNEPVSSPSSPQVGSLQSVGVLSALIGFAMIYFMFRSFEPLPQSAPWLLTASFGAGWVLTYIGTNDPMTRRNAWRSGAVRSGILCGILFFLFHSLVDFDLYEQGVAQTIWLLMAIGLSSCAAEGRTFTWRLTSAGQMAVALPTILIVGLLLCGIYPRILEAKIRVENARDLLAAKQSDRAISEWREAARLDPWNADIQMALAEVFSVLWRTGIKEYEGDSTFELSLRHVRRAIELNPLRARFHHFHARLLQEASQRAKSPEEVRFLQDAARDEFEKAYRLFPTRAPYAADLAFAYESAGRQQEALRLFEQALTLDHFARPERYTTKLAPDVRREIEKRLAEARKKPQAR